MNMATGLVIIYCTLLYVWPYWSHIKVINTYNTKSNIFFFLLIARRRHSRA